MPATTHPASSSTLACGPMRYSPTQTSTFCCPRTRMRRHVGAHAHTHLHGIVSLVCRRQFFCHCVWEKAEWGLCVTDICRPTSFFAAFANSRSLHSCPGARTRFMRMHVRMSRKRPLTVLTLLDFAISCTQAQGAGHISVGSSVLAGTLFCARACPLSLILCRTECRGPCLRFIPDSFLLPKR